ncbi:MAG: hypothetical protein RLZZ71_152 [Bacteroidota bacterium]|jgi:glycosyltransferase involved in cell wall biosynthesis
MVLKKSRRIIIVASADFLNNKAGGAQVLESNIYTILEIQEYLHVVFIDFQNSRLTFKHFDKKNPNKPKIRILCLPNMGRFSKTFYKFILYTILGLNYKKILCEHFYSLPNFKLTPNFIKKKIVYSHHDFLFEIKSLRHNKDKSDLRVVELNTLQKCEMAISGNHREAEYLRSIGVECAYLPINTRFLDVSIDFDNTSEIFHLGSFETTASLNGYKNFQSNILPHLDGSIKIFLIGSKTDLITKCECEIGLGYVEDLGAFLKRGTINIIPWKFGTGQRTRVFEAISRGNVIVSYLILGEIIPELVNGENCLLVENEIEFAQAITDLISNRHLRSRISNGALLLSEKFSLTSRVSKFRYYLGL